METVHYLDANAIIAIVELTTTPEAGQLSFAAAMQRGEVLVVTSELTLAECLVGPYKSRNRAALEAYWEFFEGDALAVVPVSREILVRAAELRAETQMKMVDSVHVATAESTGCHVVVSEDKRLRVPEGMRLVRWTGFRLDN